MSTLATRSLSVDLGGRRVLEGVTIDVASGHWVGLIGPNGAGKTTLLRSIAGTVAYRGDVLVDGEQASALSRRARAQRVALVPQRPVLPSAMTVADYVLLGRGPYISYLDTESAHDLDVVRATLDRLGIAAFATRALGSLSGGEQQRVVLARAIAQEARVLLLDEGTSALDIGGQLEVLELVEHLRRDEELTVISAMHDLTLAARFAERLVLLSRGVVACTGTPDDVLTTDRIAEHFGAVTAVVRTEGGLVVVPLRSGPGSGPA